MKYIYNKIVEAIEYLKQNPSTSINKVCKVFEVNKNTLQKYLKDDIYLKYKHVNPSHPNLLYYFTDEEIEIINHYYELSEISYENFKVKYPSAPKTRETFIKWVQIFGLTLYSKSKSGNRYKYDKNKFKTISTEEDAYWLGFITADGCLIGNERLSFSLARKDRAHLEKFCIYMGLSQEDIKNIIKDSYGGAYKKDNPTNILNICSVKIVKNLRDKGIENRKSGKEKPYICSTIELEKAYIRGLIDGDGYIRSSGNLIGFGIVGSYEICNYIKNFIQNNIVDITNNNITTHDKIFRFAMNNKEKVPEILSFFYKDANIYLDRKFEIYKKKILPCLNPGKNLED